MILSFYYLAIRALSFVDSLQSPQMISRILQSVDSLPQGEVQEIWTYDSLEDLAPLHTHTHTQKKNSDRDRI